MGRWNQRKTTSEVLEDINRRLSDIDSELSELVAEAQTVAEASPGFSSHFTNDETGEPICVPEDACPELDGARVQIDEAINIIRDAIESKRCLICDSPINAHNLNCPDQRS